MVSDKMDDIVLREKEKSLHMSRVPKKVKEQFIEIANEEYEGDYGMLLKTLIDKYFELETYYANFDIKLNYLVDMMQNQTQQYTEKKEKPKEIKTLGEKRAERRQKENE